MSGMGTFGLESGAFARYGPFGLAGSYVPVSDTL